jgi:hypothetical protein
LEYCKRNDIHLLTITPLLHYSNTPELLGLKGPLNV